MNTLINWVINTLVIMVAAYILPGVHVDNIWAAFVVALVLGVLNILIKPILVVLTLPVTIISFGLFLLVINAMMVVMVSHIVPGFSVDSFTWALLFSAVVSLINLALQRMSLI
jgi:putative membrane protein